MEREKPGTWVGQGMSAKGWEDWSSESRAAMLRISEVEQVRLGNDTVQAVTEAVREATQRSRQ